MGVFSFLGNIKDWAFSHAGGKEEAIEPPAEKYVPNLGEDIRQVMHTPEFENAMDASSPFLLVILGAWPGYWLYRGLDYHSHRAYVPLPIYIRQTFFQAKILQLAILMVGIFSVLKEHHRPRIMKASKTN